MGMSSGGSGNGGRRRRGRGKRQPMSEINVTPFVDVMLVLLIIFMVTAPLLAVGVPIELPETRAKQLPAADKEPLTLTVDRQGKIFLQDSEIQIEEIGPKLIAITKNGYEEPIYIRGDRQIDYGAVMKVMGQLSQSGFRKISLVTDLDAKS